MRRCGSGAVRQWVLGRCGSGTIEQWVTEAVGSEPVGYQRSGAVRQGGSGTLG